jgi:heptosyltransferase-2
LPELEVHFLTKGKFKQVVNGNPHLDRVFEWENAADKSEMFSTDYDLIVDLHNNLRTRLVKWRFWGVPTRVLSKENVQKMLLVGRSKYLLLNYMLKFRWIQQLFFGFSGEGNSAEWGSSSRHISSELAGTDSGEGNSAEWGTTKHKLAVTNIVVRNLSLLSALKIDKNGLEPSSSELELDFFVEEPSVALELPQKFVALVLGGTYATKQMPLELLVKILNQFNGSVVLLGGPAESKLADDLLNALNRLDAREGSGIFNYCGKLNLNDSAWVASKSRVVVSGDTGMAHIAAALGCNLVMVWGNTVPEFGMVPPVKQGAKSHHFNVLDLDCRPCSKLGFESCPKQHFRCMNGQDSQAIRASMEKYL